MRVALGSDIAGELPEAIDRWLRGRNFEVVRFGALTPGSDEAWPSIGRAVGECVARGEAQYGVLCCWTGTGVSIAANKVPGIRAALCGDAATAGGAREWNDANVLCLSIRATAAPVAEEMLDAWFAASPTRDPVYRAMIAALEKAEGPRTRAAPDQSAVHRTVD
ncbi:MAG: RpiB/LacA/LacB family sugar-phosphate isomerase [Candidatus Cybelea sp.]|jgi:ribose 5-phosphate isomerase B